MTAPKQEQAPFSFDCHRCGNCCRVGRGQVWATAEEVGAMAARLGIGLEGFTARFLRQVDGRLSLREEADGSCSLLQGQNRCTVYEARPEQCRTFPYWPSLMQEGRALELAAGYCLGLQRYPSPEVASTVLPKVRLQLQDAGAVAIPRDTAPDRHASSLEVDLYLATGRRLQVDDAIAREQLRRGLQQLAEAERYPWSYAPWAGLLADRRGGWASRGGLPALSSA